MQKRISRRRALELAAGGAAGAVGLRLLVFDGHSPAKAGTSGASGASTGGSWASPLNGRRALAAHLLRRAGFGYSTAELDQAASISYSDLVDKLVSAAPDPLKMPTNFNQYTAVVTAWYAHMATTPAQFPERMTLFWHGLLTSDYRKSTGLPFVAQQNALYRKLGTGDLRSLLVAVTADPLMMRYLDLDVSTARSPNENYARELMELFTLGVGNFTETDVREGARALSGMRLVFTDPSGNIAPIPRPPQAKNAEDLRAYYQQLLDKVVSGYTFSGRVDPRRHDQGIKHYLGRTGNLAPDDVIDVILSQDACAPFIATKALVYFATPSPSKDYVARVASAFRSSKYDIKTLLRTIFTSPEFLSAANYRSLVRSPADYMVATMRALGRADLAPACTRAGAGMDQILYDMPTVGGWPVNAGWVSSSSWLARLNFANTVLTSAGALPDPAVGVTDQLDGTVGADTSQVFDASSAVVDKWYALLSSPEFHLK